MALYRLKGRFQSIVRGIGGDWMTADHATLLGWACVAAIACSFYFGVSSDRVWLWGVPLFSLLRLAMNALDGMLAREKGTASAAGELWNELSDVAGDTISYGALYFVPGGPDRSLTLFLLLTWAAEFVGVLAKSLPGGRRLHNSVGGGKPERALWMSLYAIVVFFDPRWITQAPLCLGFFSLLILMTCLARIRKALEGAKGKDYESYTPVGR